MIQQNSRPPPFPPPPSPAPPPPSLSLSTLLCVLSCSLFLPSFLFLSFLPTLLFIPCHWLTLSPSLSLPFPEVHVSLLALHTITSIHQLSAYSSLASSLPFLDAMTTPHPHYPAYTCFLATPFSHLPPLWAAECTSPHTCSPSPSPSLSSPKAQSFCSYPIPDVPRVWVSVCMCGRGTNKGAGWWVWDKWGCRVGGGGVFLPWAFCMCTMITI